MTRPSIAWLIAGGFAVVLIARELHRLAAPAATVRRVVSVDTVYRDIPVERTSFVDRIVYKVLKPETILVSVPGAVQTRVEQFCARSDTAEGGTSAAKSTQLVLTAGRVEGRKLTLFGFTNTAEAYRGTWSARAPYEFRTQDSIVVVDEKRRLRLPWWLRDGAIAAGGFYLGWKF